jgi:alpha-tubulin suppressor-like RCC1 family protein
VVCWGYNKHNELGDGTTRERWSPVAVTGPSAGVSAIATGARHGCALTGGGVKCWGYNYYGQLGDGTNANRAGAVYVSGLGRGVTAIAGGAFHTCALMAAGTVKCWGLNILGQLGDDTEVERWTPVDVVGLGGNAIAVAAGDSHSCAILQGGRVKCWGENRYGQLGDGTTQRHLTPVDVSGLSRGVTALSLGGRHSCAIVGGIVKCWGGNLFGQIGDGTRQRRLVPVRVAGLRADAIAIAVGDGHSCALTVSEGLRCWGYNGWGQLGDGTDVDRLSAVAVSGLRRGVTAVAAGARHTCARTATGSVKCWGYNLYNQLGDGMPAETRLQPGYVVGLGVATATLSIRSRSTAVGPARTVAIDLRCGPGGRLPRDALVVDARPGRSLALASATSHRQARCPRLLARRRIGASGEDRAHSPRPQAARVVEKAAGPRPGPIRATRRHDLGNEPSHHLDCRLIDEPA